MPTLYMMIGIMGAGKSTYIKNNYANLPVVCPDAIRVELLQQVEENKDKIEGELIDKLYIQESRVWAIAQKRTVDLLSQGRSMVFDAMNLFPKARRQLFKWTQDIDVDIVAVFIDVELEQALKQNKFRGEQITGYRNGKPIYGRMVPEDILKEKYNKLIPPTLSEGFSQIINVH